jgi:5-(carboxyamino)imidazole ribonucleotide mutase
MLAALTPLPVVGVPVQLSALAGLDSLLSIVQMPSDVPVATVAIGAGRNAGLLAARILASSDADLRQRLVSLAERAEATAGEQDSRVRTSQQTRQGDRP